MFLNEKHEKDCKKKELEILKEKEDTTSDIKELRIKYDNLKAG